MASHNMQKAMTRKKMMPFFFIAPFFIIYGIFSLWPLISGVSISMHSNDTFVGFENFRTVFTDELFWKSITNASIYMVGSIFIILPIAFLAALLLVSNHMTKIRGVVSTIYFFPNVTSIIVIGIVFKLLLKTQNGTINTILQSLGLIDKPLKFLSDPDLAMVSLLILGSWRFFGINSLYFVSGLQGIPTELLDASRIDGCSALQEIFFIKIPLLKPITTYVVFTAIIGSFSLTGEIYSLVGIGGTGTKYSMLFPVIYLYNTMFRDGKMNQASAMGYLLAVILLIITAIQRFFFADRQGR